VRAAIASDAPPKYQRTPARSIVDEVEPRIRELLQTHPRMPATVIAELIAAHADAPLSRWWSALKPTADCGSQRWSRQVIPCGRSIR
jgi:hypothetical protein